MRPERRFLRPIEYRSEFKSHVTFRAGGVAIWPLPRRLRASPGTPDFHPTDEDLSAGTPDLPPPPTNRQSSGIFGKVPFVETKKAFGFVHWISGAELPFAAGIVSPGTVAGRIAGTRS